MRERWGGLEVNEGAVGWVESEGESSGVGRGGLGVKQGSVGAGRSNSLSVSIGGYLYSTSTPLVAVPL